MHKVHIHKLSNGVTTVIVPLPDTTSAAATVLVRTGLSHEQRPIRGISHFLEHMCFKGTVSRPSPLAIASSFERLGAVNNAFTSRDVTGYWAKVAPRHLNDVLDLLADMYFHPLFDRREIEKEKGVIVEEINMYEDNPRWNVERLLEETMYGDRHAGWAVAGTRQTVRAVTKEKLRAYRRAHYNGASTIVIIAGNVDVRDVERRTKALFKPLTRGTARRISEVPNAQRTVQTAAHVKKLDQVHMALGVKTFSLYSPHRFTLGVLSKVLGGGMGSRLFQRIREKMGAAYYAASSASLFATHGILDVGMGVTISKADEALRAAVEELARMAKEPVSDEELSRAKEHMIGRLYLSLETPDEIADFYGDQVAMHERLKSPRDIERAVWGVSATAVQRLAQHLMKPNALTVTAVGPDVNAARLKRIASSALAS